MATIFYFDDFKIYGSKKSLVKLTMTLLGFLLRKLEEVTFFRVRSILSCKNFEPALNEQNKWIDRKA